MLPKLSRSEIAEKVNKVGFNVFPDLLLSGQKCKDMLSTLYEEFPDLFQSMSEIGPGAYGFSRAREGQPTPEQTFVLTPKGGTLTFSDPAFQGDDTLVKVTNSVMATLRRTYPVRRFPRVGRIVEVVHKWSEGHDPHSWLMDNFTVFRQPADDVLELNFRILYRTSGMNINTFFNPVRHRMTNDWGLQIVCDINNADTSADVTSEQVRTIVDFSTLYFPDRVFEFINGHVEP
ncbi:MAG: hypothetical protein WC712_10030 [Candidatus Brocadiia bacterium]